MVFIYRIRYCAKQVVASSFISQSEEIPYCRESDSALKLCVKSKKFFLFFFCVLMRIVLWRESYNGCRKFGLIDFGNHLVTR